jgi:hypothetical protein
MKPRVFGSTVSLAVLMVLIFTAGSSAHRPAATREPALPIVFVHGGSGSAAQYQTQAMRWSSNGYPNLVTALDRVSETIQPVNEQMDDFFDAVLEKTGDDRIYVIGHSAGVAILKNYLNSSPVRSARVSKFIALDSSSAGENPECPGNPGPVDCMGIYRDDNPNYMGSNMVRLPLHGHTQCVTSAESFIEQYKFLTGKEPRTTRILPNRPGKLEVAGRVVYFPDNTSVDGATLRLWEIDGDTGARLTDLPKKVIDIDPDGHFGPVNIERRKYYEFSLLRSDVDFETHYYYQPFIRSDYLLRLLATPADSVLLDLAPQGPDHTALVIIRYKEWWNDQETGHDTLWVTSTSPTWDNDPVYPTPSPMQNILSDPAIAPRSSHKLGIHVHDMDQDKLSTLSPIAVYDYIAFQAGVDIWMPSTAPPDGAITLMNEPRGDTAKPQTITVPNWASEGHRVLVIFNDYVRDINCWSK